MQSSTNHWLWLWIRVFPATIAALATLAAFPAGRAYGAGLLIANGGFGGQLEIKEQTVNVTINNGIAVTTVTQIFKNDEDRQVEALYTFPVPNKASVSNFSMWINGKEMIGEVLEKKKAREIYNSYKQARRDPGLLEQVDYKTFEMRVFPIAPRAEQKVQVVYYQELDIDRDWATYVYPLATTTRRVENAKTSGKFALTLDAKSQVPIVAMESPSHPQGFAIAKHSQMYYQASLETKDGDLSRDVVLAYHLDRPHTGMDLIASKQGKDDGYFSLTLTAGEELKQQDTGMDYVFILDVSGSMNDDGKLDLSRHSLDQFIKSLGAADRFEVMTFNVAAHPFFSSLVNADDDHKAKAAAFLASQEARGGTVLAPALNTAYKYVDSTRPLNVIILSDGLTEASDTATLLHLIQSRPAGSRVFCVGVGNDVNKPLLENIAQQSGGLAAFLSRGDDFARQAEAFRRKLMRPVISDPKIAFGNVAVYDVEPKQLSNLYYGAPIRLYGRYKDGGPVQVTLTGQIGSTPLNTTAAMDLPKQDSTNPEIERMWAWQKVNRLLKEADATGSRTSVMDEVVRLGEAYSIATEATSFIVLENDAEYQRWHIERRNALRLDRDRASQLAFNEQLEKMRSDATNALGPNPVAPKQLVELPTQQPTVAAPAASTPIDNAAMPNLASHNANVDLSGNSSHMGFGGAIDPLTGGIALALASLALARSLRRRRAA